MTLADTLWVMNKGLVEQKGAPLEVYERPRSKFVATFLGSPQMNLLAIGFPIKLVVGLWATLLALPLLAGAERGLLWTMEQILSAVLTGMRA